MRIAMTGGHGFLGWHFACLLFAETGQTPTRLGRADAVDAQTLAAALSDHGVVIHLAAVNRAPSDKEVLRGNVAAARSLAEALLLNGRPVRLVYASSIQAGNDSAYGRGKLEAGRILGDAVARVGGSLATVKLPNLFGEHGRPGYNSFVATFCHLVATAGEPSVSENRTVPLLHAQRAARVLRAACNGSEDETLQPEGTPCSVADVLGLVRGMHEVYRSGQVPSLHDEFAVDLFNTYRSFLPVGHFPMVATSHADARGNLVEVARSHGGTSQSFVSTTEPGSIRGNHFHLRKFERFLVVDGEADIALRRLYDGRIVRHRVNGSNPAFVDMPTMWTHSIRNVGSKTLVTAFWADQLLDPNDPDQYPLDVERKALP